MKVTDAFLGEHAVFYAQFNHMEETIPDAPSTCVVRTQSSMLGAALASHAQLEDELLFVPLEPHMGVHGGPLAVMRMEHSQIEGGLERLSTCEDLDEAKNLLLGIIQTAREHFAKEEQILYPIAHQALGEAGLTQQGDEWAKRRVVNIHAQGAPGCHLP